MVLKRIINGFIRVLIYQLLVRPLSKGLTGLIWLLFLGLGITMLVGCGGSGGASGGSYSDAPGITPPDGINPPNSPITRYKGYSSDGSRLDTLSLPVADFQYFQNIGYIEYWDVSSHKFDVMVENPTCLLGGAYEDYSMTLISDSGTISQVSVRRTISGITWTEHLVGTLRSDTSTINIPTACNDGYTVGGGNEFYANGSIIAFRNSANAIYFGIRDSLLIKTGSYSGNFNRYLYINAGEDNTAGSITMYSGGSVDPVNNMILNNQVNTGFSTNTLTYNPNSNGSTTSHISLQNQHGWMVGIYGTLAGKKIMSVSMPKTSSDCDSSGCYGIGMFILATEQ